jgi:large subunit ribosomal protein L17
MRHLQVGRKLGVDHSHRIALLRSLSLALIENEAIKTTPARAKELRWYADRIITLAKRGDLSSRRRIIQLLGSTETYRAGHNRVRGAIERVYEDLVPRFKSRIGGYTQIIRLATRRAGDNAELCVMRFMPAPEEKKEKGGRKKETPAKKKPEGKAVAATAASVPTKEKSKRKPEELKAEDQKPTKAKKKDKEG